jgi:hypothetical protein
MVCYMGFEPFGLVSGGPWRGVFGEGREMEAVRTIVVVLKVISKACE